MACWMLSTCLLAWLLLSISSSLPLCDKNKDTFGKWINVKDIDNQESSWKDHFIGGGPGEARNFSKIWITEDCATHRFTANSTESMIRSILEKRNQTEPLNIFFLGDSGTRGVFCGITRILSGSEIFGPCINEVCGTQGTIPTSHKRTHQLDHVSFGSYLTMSFMYIKSLSDKYSNWMVEQSMGKKPHAVVLNTGAWDFDEIARSRTHTKAAPECGPEQPEDYRIAQKRVSPAIVAYMKEYGDLARSLGVRAIYRNSHYNFRFGALCADSLFEAAIQNTPWEVWDNRRISKYVWENETYDGFHFDRHRVHTTTHHHQLIELNLELGKDVPGALEIQLAQSLLFLLFHDEIQHYVDAHP